MHPVRFLLLFAALAGPASSQTPQDKELALGRHLQAQIESTHRIIADPQVNAFANGILQTLSAHQSLRLPLTLQIIDDPGILVASALPGGTLLLSSGAILRAQTEPELAALLAHAMGHVQTGQFTWSTRIAGNTGPLIFLGGPWGYCERSSDGTTRTMLFPKRIPQSALFESQADLLALGYLVNAGFDPQALNNVYERWNGKLRPDDQTREKALSLAKFTLASRPESSDLPQIQSRLPR
jgi:predicted Zn-dependent protease